MISLALALAAVPVQTALPPAPAGTVSVSAAQQGLAKQVVVLLHLRDSFLATLPAMRPIIAQQALAAIARPGSPFAAYAGDDAKKQKVAQIFGEEFVKAFEEQAAGFDDAVARSYAQRMTTAELTALLTFLKTPAGAKWGSIQPDITRDGQQIGASMGMLAGMKASAAALERAKAEIK